MSGLDDREFELMRLRTQVGVAEAKAESWVAAHDEQVAVVMRLGAERDRIATVLREIATQACREWCDDKNNICGAPAEFVLWGRLFKPEALGPRCYDHAAAHIGHRSLSPGVNFALIDLRPALSALDTEREEIS